MTEETIAMTQKAIDRLSVIQQVVNRQLRQREAAVQLGLSIRQVKRLVVRFRQEGPPGLVSRHLVRIPRQRDRRFQTNVTDSAIFFGICGHDGGNRGHDPWNLSQPTGILSLYPAQLSPFVRGRRRMPTARIPMKKIIEVLRPLPAMESEAKAGSPR